MKLIMDKQGLNKSESALFMKKTPINCVYNCSIKLTLI